MSNLVGYLVFNRLEIEGANTVSSPITYGFPAISAFLGAAHALSRKLAQSDQFGELQLGGVLICAHECYPQLYRTSRYSDYTLNLSRNPILRNGKTASITEEGKAHLLVTLAIEVVSEQIEELCDANIDPIELCGQLTQWVQQQPIAGGRVRSLSKHKPVSFFEPSQIAGINSVLMPGSVLMSAADSLSDITRELQSTNPEASELDALLEVCTLHHEPEFKPSGTQWRTRSARSGRGWIVPIPIGFQGISAQFGPGVMQHSRNPEYPSQFVECLYSLGKWVFPTKLHDLQSAFWRHEYCPNQSLFLTNQTQPK